MSYPEPRLYRSPAFWERVRRDGEATIEVTGAVEGAGAEAATPDQDMNTDEGALVEAIQAQGTSSSSSSNTIARKHVARRSGEDGFPYSGQWKTILQKKFPTLAVELTRLEKLNSTLISQLKQLRRKGARTHGACELKEAASRAVVKKAWYLRAIAEERITLAAKEMRKTEEHISRLVEWLESLSQSSDDSVSVSMASIRRAATLADSAHDSNSSALLAIGIGSDMEKSTWRALVDELHIASEE